MKTVVVVNPHAGRRNILRKEEEIREILSREGEVRLVETDDPGQAAQLARQAAEEGELLVCCGGDGTLSQTVDSLLRAGKTCPLGYIPAGTTNDFARSLRIPRQPILAAEHLLNSPARPLDIGLLGEGKHFVYVASFGAFTQCSYNTPAVLKSRLGHFAYVLEGMRELPELRCSRLRVETQEGERFEGDFLFGAVSNATSIGGVFRPDPAQVDFSDGSFELTLVRRAEHPAQFHRAAVALRNGRGDGETVLFTHTKGARFTWLEEPVPWSLDGEFVPAQRETEFRVLPGAISMRF